MSTGQRTEAQLSELNTKQKTLLKQTLQCEYIITILFVCIFTARRITRNGLVRSVKMPEGVELIFGMKFAFIQCCIVL